MRRLLCFKCCIFPKSIRIFPVRKGYRLENRPIDVPGEIIINSKKIEKVFVQFRVVGNREHDPMKDNRVLTLNYFKETAHDEKPENVEVNRRIAKKLKKRRTKPN